MDQSVTKPSVMNIVRADTGRDVLLVEGDDAAAFLHSQLANDITLMPVGGSTHSLLLEPTGHVHSLVRVIRHGETLFSLDVEAGFGSGVMVRLHRFVLRAKVTLSTCDWLVRSYRGHGVGRALDEASGRATVAWGDDAEREIALDVVGPVATLPNVGEPIDRTETAAMDTDLRWPRLGTDLRAGDVPATSGILSVAVSFTKGCYPGQELVERMDSRGASAPVLIRSLPRGRWQRGDEIIIDGRTVGVVTSVGRTTALARVDRGSEVGEPLR